MAVEVAEPRPEELDLETTKRITDLEVMALISAGHRNAYHRALGVMTLYPDYAMASFRKLLEQIVILVGEKLQLAFSSPDLYERINYLHECQLIGHGTKGDLHKLRLWGNQAVHTSSLASNQLDPNQPSALSAEVEKARKARKIFMAVLADFHRLLINNDLRLEIVPADVPDLVSGQVIGNAIASEGSFDAKMQAGLVLEAEWMRALSRGGVISTRISAEHAKALKSMATEMYRCACEISARLDSLSLTYIHLNGGSDALWLQRADTEALYRFGSLTYTTEPSSDLERLATSAIKEAASRKHVQASAHYGDYLRQIGEFIKAEEMLTFAAGLDESQAYLGLYFLYSTKESPCFSPVKAIGILEQGVSRDDPNCKFQLGVVFHQGELVGEDKTRARQLLTEASDQGVKRAALYLRLAVDEGFQQQLQMIGLALMAAPNAEREKYKALAPGRNDLCPCNSGKKYKKCHGQ